MSREETAWHRAALRWRAVLLDVADEFPGDPDAAVDEFEARHGREWNRTVDDELAQLGADA